MSELRWHPLLEQWVITAIHRQDRTYKPPADHCPLCPTRPGREPTEIPASSYQIVVFENRFPSLKMPPPEPAVAVLPHPSHLPVALSVDIQRRSGPSAHKIPCFFSTSIAENIAYARPEASEDEIIKCGL